MKRTISALTVALLLATCTQALAEDKPVADAAPAATSGKSEKSSDKTSDKSSSSSSDGGGVGNIPVRAASFVTGAAVGVPVAFVRKSGTEIVSATRDLVGDTDNWFLLGAGGVLGVPAGILSGALLGTFYGLKNALFSDEPFSKESFSLDDMD